MFVCSPGWYCGAGSEQPTGMCAIGHYCAQGAISAMGHGPCWEGYDCTDEGAALPIGIGLLLPIVMSPALEPPKEKELKQEAIAEMVESEESSNYTNMVGLESMRRILALGIEDDTVTNSSRGETQDVRRLTLASSASELITKLKESFSVELELEIEVGWLLDVNELMGWGGFDVVIDVGLPVIKGIAIKVGLDYFRCKDADGNAKDAPFGTGMAFGGIGLIIASGALGADGIDSFKESFRTDLNNLGSTFSLGFGFEVNSGLWRDEKTITLGDDDTRNFDVDRAAQCQPWQVGGPLDSCNGRRQLMSPPSPRRLSDPGAKATQIMRQGIDLLEKNQVTVPLCIGICDGSGKLDEKIEGEIVVGLSDTCDSAVIKGTLEEITLDNLAFAAIYGIDKDVATFVSTAFGPFGGIGLKKGATVSLTLGPGTNLEFFASGEPCLACGETVPSGSPFRTIFDIFENLDSIGIEFQMRAKLEGLNNFEVELRVALPPRQVVNGNTFWFMSKDGTRGASIFTKLRADDFRTTPIYTQSIGFDIEARICTKGCSAAIPEYLYFFGQVRVETKSVAGVPPVGRLGGVLTLDGDLRRVFGIPFLHVTYLTMGATFQMATLPFPDSFTIGGSGCIGSESACFDGKGTSIQADLYLGIDAVDPNRNFFFAGFTEVTFETVLRILAENVDSGFDDILNLLPEELLVSGIKPLLDASHPDCAGLLPVAESIEAQIANASQPTSVENGINLKCKAYISVAPFSTIEVAGLSLPQGVGFGGVINIADVFEMRVEFHADIFTPTSFGLYADIEIDPIIVGDYIEITDYSGDRGPRFLVDANAYQGRALVAISGRVALPIIFSEGKLEVVLNDRGVIAKGELDFLHGAFKPSVEIIWNWDGTLFDARLNDWILSSSFVINNLRVYTEDFAVAVSSPALLLLASIRTHE
jgi:hypothetical protein